MAIDRGALFPKLVDLLLDPVFVVDEKEAGSLVRNADADMYTKKQGARTS